MRGERTETAGYRKRAIAGWVPLAFGLASLPAAAENRLVVPAVTLPPGVTTAEVIVEAEHDFPLAGFTVNIAFSPEALRLVEVTTEGTDTEGLSFFSGPEDLEGGQLTRAGLIDFTQRVNLPPVAPGEPLHTLFRMTFETLAPPGSTSAIVLAEELVWEEVPPTRNALVGSNAMSVRPLLESGSVTTSSPTMPFVRGDSTTDGRFNLADVVDVLNFLFGRAPEPSCPDAADADDSGAIDPADPMRALSALFGDGGPLPAPTACGLDPSDDPLSCPDLAGCG
jgi:hypothetical protein